MARRKPNPVIIADRPQAEGALAEIAVIDRKLTGIETDMNTAIDAAKAAAGQASAPLLARRADLENAVATWATLNKAELFMDRKSIDLGFGVVGFRQATKLRQVPRVTVAMTLERLRELGFLDGIRVKEEVNKEVAAGWPASKLELVGLKRHITDDFYIEIAREDVERAA
jgi:phage host-nuclease inhibitor protein Gam